jgi:hypothetical protein
VADFALPWSDAYWLTNRPRYVEWIDRQLEKFVVGAARHITVAYDGIKHNLADTSGHLREDKITVVPTGFEEELFIGPNPCPSPKFTIVYPGNHFCEQGRNGEHFLQAIDDWLELNPALEDAVDFVFIGKPDDGLLRARAAMAHPGVIRVEPLISHRSCIRVIQAAHACVVNTYGNRVPAKLYECMRAGKWVLALTSPGSDLSKTVHAYSKGFVVSATNRSGIRQALQSVWELTQSGMIESSKQDGSLSSYRAKRSAESLAIICARLFAAETLAH